MTKSNKGKFFVVNIVSMLILCSSALAGDKICHSKARGLFFSFFNPNAGTGEVYFENLEHRDELIEHCNSGGVIYLQPQNSPHKCKVVFPYIDDGISVEIKDISYLTHELEFGLFSIEKTKNIAWDQKLVSKQERKVLNRKLPSELKQDSNLLKQIEFDMAQSVMAKGSQITTYIVPGQIIKEEFYEARRHHIFIKKDNEITYVGQIADTPKRYFDLDGDLVPEIETDESCDGWCISIWKVVNGTERIADFGGH